MPVDSVTHSRGDEENSLQAARRLAAAATTTTTQGVHGNIPRSHSATANYLAASHAHAPTFLFSS